MDRLSDEEKSKLQAKMEESRGRRIHHIRRADVFLCTEYIEPIMLMVWRMRKIKRTTGGGSCGGGKRRRVIRKWLLIR